MGLYDVIETEASRDLNWRPEAPPPLDGIDDICLDVETTGLEWYGKDEMCGFSVYYPDGRTRYYPFKHRAGHNLDEDQLKRWAQRELRGKRVHNIATKIDNHFFYKWGVDLEEQGCTLTDVAFDAALLDDHRFPNQMSLAALCTDFLPEHERKVIAVGGMPLNPTRMAEYPSDIVAVRAEADVRQVHLLRQVFEPQIREQGLHRVRDVENQLIYPVCEMERNGMPLNVPLLEDWTRASEQQLHRELRGIAHDMGFPCNPDSNKDWIRVFEKFKLPITKTDEGAPSFTDDILQRIEVPLVQRLRMAGKLASLRSKYLIPYSAAAAKNNGILRYHLHQMMCEEGGSAPGRFSSSDENIQQVMKSKKQIASFGHDQYLIRELLIPGAGMMTCSADGRQIEYRFFAEYANSPRINKAFADDPLTNFHKLIFSLLKPHHSTLTYEHTKNINFMRIYGGGLLKLALMMGFLSQQEADELQDERDAWKKAGNKGVPTQPKLDAIMEIDDIYNRELPEVRPLLEKTRKLAEDRGFVRTILGRRGRFTGKHKARAYKAFNTVGQGGGADYMKVKILELHQCRKVTGFKMRATVHDQVVGDAPDHESARRVGWVLDQQSFKLRIPILWETKTGKNWKECD